MGTTSSKKQKTSSRPEPSPSQQDSRHRASENLDASRDLPVGEVANASPPHWQSWGAVHAGSSDRPPPSPPEPIPSASACNPPEQEPPGGRDPPLAQNDDESIVASPSSINIDLTESPGSIAQPTHPSQDNSGRLTVSQPEESPDPRCCCLCSSPIENDFLQLSYQCPHQSSRAYCCHVCTPKHARALLASGTAATPRTVGPRACPVPGCSGTFPEEDLSRVAHSEYNAWAQEASEALIEEMNCTRCPNPSCGAIIERLAASELPIGMEPTGCPEIDRTGPRPDIGPNGKPMTRAATVHKYKHRFRCAICHQTFCDSCNTSPYHEGMTCEEHAAPRCAYCQTTPLPGLPRELATISEKPLKELRASLMGGGCPDLSWCIERGDYEAVYCRVASTCAEEDCRSRLSDSCTRTLPCGHQCGGVREEDTCLPCLICPLEPLKPLDEEQETPKEEQVFIEGEVAQYVKNGSRQPAMIVKVDRSLAPPAYTVQLEDGTERETEAERLEKMGEDQMSEDAPDDVAGNCLGCQPCLLCQEPLATAPTIKLEECGHMYHLHCCRQRLRSGYPGPNISFGHLLCPLCGAGQARGNCQVASKPTQFSHQALRSDLEAHLKLKAAVAAQAKARVRVLDPERMKDLLPGGKWDGRPVDYAMENFMFYQCHRCKRPYYGGERQCGAGPAARNGDWKPEELLCPGCSSSDSSGCPEHGTEFIEWKCRYCCSNASWCCFGGVHMCNSCHDKYTVPGGWGSSWQPEHCKGPHVCPLGVAHPRNGKEHCLGCALCRASGSRS